MPSISQLSEISGVPSTLIEKIIHQLPTDESELVDSLIAVNVMISPLDPSLVSAVVDDCEAGGRRHEILNALKMIADARRSPVVEGPPKTVVQATGPVPPLQKTPLVSQQVVPPQAGETLQESSGLLRGTLNVFAGLWGRRGASPLTNSMKGPSSPQGPSPREVVRPPLDATDEHTHEIHSDSPRSSPSSVSPHNKAETSSRWNGAPDVNFSEGLASQSFPQFDELFQTFCLEETLRDDPNA